jgi:putative flippase GtrA
MATPGLPWRRWLKFVAGGLLNTTVTYAIYLLLLPFIPYTFAFFLAYAAGILVSYWFNSRIVFEVRLSLKGLVFFPVVYVVQFLVSVVSLRVLVEMFNVSEKLAPLVVVVAMVPVTYLLSKAVLLWSARTRESPDVESTNLDL